MQPQNKFEDLIDKARPKLSAEEIEALWSRIAEHTGTKASPVPSPYWLNIVRRTSITPFIITLMLIVGAGGTVAAAEFARPGDLLFPIERATERARLAMASNERKESLRASFADKRLTQLRSIIGDVAETDDTSTSSLAVSTKGELRITTAVNAVVDILEEIESDTERERILAALHSKIEQIKVKDRGTLNLRSDDGNDSRLQIKDDRIEFRDGAYRLRINSNGDMMIRDKNDSRKDVKDRDDDQDKKKTSQNNARSVEEIEVEVKNGIAKIEIKHKNEKEETFSLPFVSETALIATLAERTGLSQAAIEAVLDVEYDD